jgi:hypothetical protein
MLATTIYVLLAVFWSPTEPLEQRHFLPFVWWHLLGSTSALPGQNGAHPTAK